MITTSLFFQVQFSASGTGSKPTEINKGLSSDFSELLDRNVCCFQLFDCVKYKVVKVQCEPNNPLGYGR